MIFSSEQALFGPWGSGMSPACRDWLNTVGCTPLAHPEFPDATVQATRMACARKGCHSPQMVQEHAALRIFIADDSLVIRQRVVSLLGASAMTVVGQAKTPRDSISGILAACPDVVVLDVQLEGGSGLQVLRAIRHAAPDIAFVVFSNRSDPIYRKRYLCEGADDFLDKTHQFDQLAKAVLKASQHADC